MGCGCSGGHGCSGNCIAAIVVCGTRPQPLRSAVLSPTHGGCRPTTMRTLLQHFPRDENPLLPRHEPIVARGCW